MEGVEVVFFKFEGCERRSGIGWEFEGDIGNPNPPKLGP